MYYYLDKRCEEILKLLVYSNNSIKVEELSSSIGVSRRSIYYDLKKINDYLEANHIEPLEQHRSKGIVLTKQQKEGIRALAMNNNKTVHVFTPTERRAIQICELIIHRKEIYIEDLVEKCDVSRNTIINDIKQLSIELKAYHVTVHYNIRSGYTLVGEPLKKRAVFFKLFPSLLNYYNNQLDEKQQSLVNDTIAKLKMVEKELDTQYVSGILPTLAMYIVAIASKNEDIIFNHVNLSEIVSSLEYQLVEKYFPNLIISEKVYVTLHLLGSRLQTVPVNVGRDDEQANRLAEGLVDEFENIAYMHFENRQDLIKAIASHLKSSLYRYKYGIQLGNPMLKDIVTEYDDLFNLTKTAAKMIERELDFVISDDEVAYLTLHFGAYIVPRKKMNKELKILVVCANGVGTSIMLKNEIAALVPQASVVENIALAQYKSNHDYDLVISTSYIENEKSLIVVHPILTDYDRVSILRKCLHAEPFTQMHIKDIVDIAQKYIPKEKLEQFKEELQQYYSMVRIKNAPLKENEAGILDYLDESMIKVLKDHYEWDSAIRIAAEPLLQKDMITAGYVDSIIHQQINDKSYMFLADGLVLAHSATENGVKNLGVSLATFAQPVVFLNGKTAQVIITLAAENKTNHIAILNDIIKIFSQRSNIALVAAKNTAKEIIAFLQKELAQ